MMRIAYLKSCRQDLNEVFSGHVRETAKCFRTSRVCLVGHNFDIILAGYAEFTQCGRQANALDKCSQAVNAFQCSCFQVACGQADADLLAQVALIQVQRPFT